MLYLIKKWLKKVFCNHHYRLLDAIDRTDGEGSITKIYCKKCSQCRIVILPYKAKDLERFLEKE